MTYNYTLGPSIRAGIVQFRVFYLLRGLFDSRILSELSDYTRSGEIVRLTVRIFGSDDRTYNFTGERAIVGQDNKHLQKFFN